MNTSELEQFFQSAWLSTIKGCMEKIRDREDKRIVRSFRSYDDIVEHLIEDADDPLPDDVLRELAMIRPRIVELRDFSHDFAERLGPKLDPSVFWGLMGAMLTVATQAEEGDENPHKALSGDEGPTRRITQMLKRLSRDVELLRDHSSSHSAMSNKEKEAVFETFAAATKFFANAVQFFRNEEHFIRCQSSDQDPWQLLKDTFNLATHDIGESLKTIEKAAALSASKKNDMTWLYSMMSMNPRTWQDEATLPCVMLPPARNTKFFDRDDVISQIEDHFGRQPAHMFHSIALYGMGGVGKTHVAMKYAQGCVTKRAVDAVLWVEGESRMKVKQSFTDIAKRLKLPNYVPNSHDDNQVIVLNWLQQTNAKWLIIYDNVESFDDLHAHWPSSVANGHALITTRNTELAYEPAERGIEVAPWDTETGSRFLLYLLSAHISSDILANQSQSALELSERLSGHALALDRMGGVIHRRCWTIQQLVEAYDSQPELKNGIGPVWTLSFQNLSPNGSSLLSIFSFCSADSIPLSLLEPENAEALTKDLPWCTDAEKFSQAMEELQTLSLARKDRTVSMLSVHRLIQSHFQDYLGAEGRQDAYNKTSKLIHFAFPQRAPQLHDLWNRCSLYAPHIIALKNAFRQERQRNPKFTACREFCEVATTCQRFLLEQHEFSELQDLCAVNQDALLSLNGEEELYDMSSSIPSYLGQMYLRSGYHRKGLECLRRSLKIRLQQEGGDKMEVSWAEHNIGEAYVTMGELTEAFTWLERAATTWKEWSVVPSQTPRREFSPFQRMTLATCQLYMGRIDEARLTLAGPLQEYLETAAESWANAAYATFLLGRIEMAEHNFAAAESCFMKAQNLWLSFDKARTSYFNGACMYRMGCCALDEGNVDAAVKHITDAMVVTTIHKDHMVGEHARCLYKLSQALLQDVGKENEAEMILQQAESLYFTRSEDRNKTLTEEDYDGLVHLRWR